jgi:23S rRNA pseudouridine1911/1915/1917 synthase
VALIAAHPEVSRRKAREVIEKGQVSLSGQTVREPGRRVEPGAEIRWDPNRPALPRARISLPLLHQDESLLIVDKPAGLLTVPTSADAHHEDTALARVKDFVQHLTPRRPFVGVVHRIDRDTSGAVAFALSAAAREALRALFKEHRIERRYAALVEGEPAHDQGVVDRPLHETYEGGKRRVAKGNEPSVPAVTRYTVRERFAGAALLDVELETGRQHQIRVHLAHVGLPILGDPVYNPRKGRPAIGATPRQMLHARILAFVHPVTGETVRVESPLPEDFRAALATLRRGSSAKGRPRPRRTS